MKKLFPLIIGAAALCGCSNSSKPSSIEGIYDANLQQATSFADTLATIDGVYIGGVFNNRARVYDPNIIGTDKAEMLRGIRTVLAVDTANRSYISGLQMGLEIVEIFREHNALEPYSKQLLLDIISQAFMVDSLNLDQLRQVQKTSLQLPQILQKRKERRDYDSVYNSRQAVENRMLGEAVIAKYKTNPDFNQISPEGLLKKTVTPGDSIPLDPNSPVRVTLVERRADSGHIIRSLAPIAIFPDEGPLPSLRAALPYMSMGETAVFIIPYQLAYGIPGDKTINVNPCETIIAEITVSQ